MRLRNSLLIAVLLLGGCSRKPPETSVFIEPQFSALVPPDTTMLVGLRVENLVMEYPAGRHQKVHAVSDVSLDVKRGETLVGIEHGRRWHLRLSSQEDL